jgi:alpha-N-acetylglucosamine transferase
LSTGNRAWVTLLTKPSYVAGVRTLRASLEKSGTTYPLVVLVTEGVDADSRRLLTAEGCRLIDAEPIGPPQDSPNSYANARFAEVWTKLAAWHLVEFERVVFLDADMLVLQNMDELFTLELAPGTIAACHACRCNPNRIASYPASWTPEICEYTHAPGADRGLREEGVDNYLNGGLLVLSPDEAVFADMVATLATIDDLSRFPFAEQDFLNEYYRGCWQPLPYVYNALKTLKFQHPLTWDLAAVKNIHYIIDKPWDQAPDPSDRYYELNQLWWDVAADITPVSVGGRSTDAVRY